MAITIQGNDCVDAWKKASTHLLGNGGSDYNMLITIGDVSAFQGNWIETYNAKSIAAKYNSIKNVIWAIFPYKHYERGASKEALYKSYPEYHKRFKKIRQVHGAWERSYFLRMISFGDTKINQIDKIITAINSSSRKFKAAFNIHLSSAEYDNNVQRIGAPCLQYLQICHTDDDKLNLIAVYRNHDYLNKALANFIGLSKLLMFICSETGKEPGTLVCHSIHAYTGSKTDLTTLIART
jgi:thymidylate synthase